LWWLAEYAQQRRAAGKLTPECSCSLKLQRPRCPQHLFALTCARLQPRAAKAAAARRGLPSVAWCTIGLALGLEFLSCVQFLPGPEGEGIHEDSLESWHMLTHSLPRWAIPAILAANSLTLLGYNVAGMFVTSELGAVTRTVFESARTLFVWLGDLLLFYTPLGLHGKLGEAWDRSSYIQARRASVQGCLMPTRSSGAFGRPLS